MDVDCFIQILKLIVHEHRALAARLVIGTVYIKGFAHETDEEDVDALTLLEELSVFRAVNCLCFQDVSLVNLNDAFFKRCREIGILALSLYGHDDEIPVEWLVDFCFGVTSKALEHAERCVDGLVSFDKELPRRMLEV